MLTHWIPDATNRHAHARECGTPADHVPLVPAVDAGAESLGVGALPGDRPAHETGASESSAGRQLPRQPVLPPRKARLVAPTVREQAADRGDDRLVDDKARAPSLALEAKACAERSPRRPGMDDA